MPADAGDGGISQGYLDGLCGTGWEGNAGSGNEEPLEAALLALCRGAGAPPDECFDPVSPFTQEDQGSNAGFPREDSELLVLVLTDEGDNSRRMQQGQTDPEVYATAFAAFVRPLSFSAIGPRYDSADGDGSCLNGATTWGVERLQLLAGATGGVYMDIAEAPGADGSCPLADIGDLMGQLAGLME